MWFSVRAISGHLLLVAGGKRLDLQIGQQALDVAIGKLAAIDAGGRPDALDGGHPAQRDESVRGECAQRVEGGGQRQVHLVHFIGFVHLVFVRFLETVNLQSLPLPWTSNLRISSNVRNSATILTR